MSTLPSFFRIIDDISMSLLTIQCQLLPLAVSNSPSIVYALTILHRLSTTSVLRREARDLLLRMSTGISSRLRRTCGWRTLLPITVRTQDDQRPDRRQVREKIAVCFNGAC